MKKKEKGAIIVLFALMLPVLIGAAGLAIDLGLAYLITTELQNAADMAALSGARRMTEVLFNNNYAVGQKKQEINRIIENMMKLNTIRFSGEVEMNPAQDVRFGLWTPPNLDDGTPGFFQEKNIQNDPGNVNAVEVTIRQGSGAQRNEPFSWRLARVLGLTSDATFQRTAIAMASVRRIVFALDLSNSMDNETYPGQPPNCPGATIFDPSERIFIFAPKSEYDAAECLGGPPQPAWDVLETTHDFIVDPNNHLFNRFYGIGLVVYGSIASQRIPAGNNTVTANENKNDVITEIDSILNNWNNYKDAEGNLITGYPAWNPDMPYPGDPLGQDDPNDYIPDDYYYWGDWGFTNIGHAIKVSINMLALGGASQQDAHVNQIILLSDGMATCKENDPPTVNDCAWCDRTAPPGSYNECTAGELQLLNLAPDYALRMAQEAANQNITIHTIYFNEGCDTGDVTEPEAYELMARIAEITGGKYFCSANASQLQQSFNVLNEESPFALVE
ncbi:MAG: hypothetical protein JW893_01205 [Candidatus Omnitrophica bacterium]|nr:hypothetical protein [Candidatus Omnitrophota bacterium]